MAPALDLETLRRDVDAGRVDTVNVAITDMQGRLQGKRIDADYFVDEVMEGYTEGCNYLMAVDIDMNTVDGYAMSSWDSGYGDMVMMPDLSTLHRVPWQTRPAQAQRRRECEVQVRRLWWERPRGLARLRSRGPLAPLRRRVATRVQVLHCSLEREGSHTVTPPQCS